MTEPWLLAALLVGVIVLTPLAELVRVPQPVLVTIFGAVLGLLPSMKPLEIEPELILPLVLPPLLFAATQKTTANEFREHAGSVLALAVGLTVSTAAVVAVTAHAAGLSWAGAWVLGAIVSPPDPVAATAVARRLKLPHRLVTILEGEGMFNDATALVLYKVTVASLVTGAFSFADTGLEFVLTVVLGVGVGFVVGYAAKLALAALDEGYAETTVTVLVPFLGYILAEDIGGSGVLAVLVLGLLLRDVGHQATTSQGYLLGRSVWNYADFLITSLVFAVLGFELVTVVRDSSAHRRRPRAGDHRDGDRRAVPDRVDLPGGAARPWPRQAARRAHARRACARPRSSPGRACAVSSRSRPPWHCRTPWTRATPSATATPSWSPRWCA